MKKRLKSKKGSAALTTVILISGILLSSGLSLLIVSSDLAISSKNLNGRTRAEFNAITCLEESINKVKGNLTFTGNVTNSNPEGSCSSVVTNDPLDTDIKIITVTSTYSVYTYNTVKKLDISTDPFSITK